MSTSKTLKDFGNKARARLEEERDKRPEIVRLEAMPPPPSKASTPSKTQAATKARSETTSNKGGRKKRPRVRSRVTTAKRSNRRGNHQTIQEDVDMNTPTISGEGDSMLVRLHGLPVETRPSDIRRFFTGLDPQDVFLLPSNGNVRIPTWDAEVLTTSRVHKYNVPRLDDGNFRVFVKFSGAPVAALAAGRSGEIISVKHYSDNDDSSDEDAKATQTYKATIAVSQISKQVATFLMRNMAIVCHHHDQTLKSTLTFTEQALHENVRKILWTTAALHLNIELNDSITYSPLVVLKDIGAVLSEYHKTNQDSHAMLQEYRQKLENTYSEITTMLPFPMLDLGSRIFHKKENVLRERIMKDPVVCLSDAAASHLEQEMDKIQQIIYAQRCHQDDIFAMGDHDLLFSAP